MMTDRFVSRALFTLLVLLGSTILSLPASASPIYVSGIPNGSTFNCSTCHLNPAGGGPRNAFGNAVFANRSGGFPNWPALYVLDSDGDGLTNGYELGDPDGVWRRGQPNPTPTWRISRPGDAADPPPCGNGRLDSGEACDGSVFGATDTCEEALPGSSGTLACSPSCTLNTSACVVPRCGDGVVNRASEQCDGVDLAGQSCDSQGFLAGALGCSATCTFNTSSCVDSICGNGTVEGSEACESGVPGSRTCLTEGFVGGVIGCSACEVDTSECLTTLCGNGTVDDGEECDTTPVVGDSCEDRGFLGGTLSCAADCRVQTALCLDSVCGDGEVTGIETCDGAPTATCADLGYDAGDTTCDGCSIDESACVFETCGNGTLDVGEFCEGSALGGASCTSVGFDAGTLACAANCGFDTSGCVRFVCGNGVLEGDEQCDGEISADADCAAEGFAGGAAACRSDCTIDLSDCRSAADTDDLDAGTTDAGTTDAGTTDASGVDGETQDVGTVDSGAADVTEDAGQGGSDAGVLPDSDLPADPDAAPGPDTIGDASVTPDTNDGETNDAEADSTAGGGGCSAAPVQLPPMFLMLAISILAWRGRRR
jgi:hypothetical protein